MIKNMQKIITGIIIRNDFTMNCINLILSFFTKIELIKNQIPTEAIAAIPVYFVKIAHLPAIT